MNLALIKRIGLWFATIFVLPMTVIPPVQAQQKQPNILVIFGDDRSHEGASLAFLNQAFVEFSFFAQPLLPWPVHSYY
jgi:hypothetical protein